MVRALTSIVRSRACVYVNVGVARLSVVVPRVAPPALVSSSCRRPSLVVFAVACSARRSPQTSTHAYIYADKILERGDALEQVARKAREIEEAGQDFKKVTVPFKRKAMCKNLKATICLCCLCTLLTLSLLPPSLSPLPYARS